MNDLSIIPECYVDTNLLETLVPPQKGYNHQKNCGQVANTMKSKFFDKFALGIIDKDKKEIAYLSEFDLLVNTESLYLYKHKTKHHYIIQIAPAVERFILKAGADLNISLSSIGLADDLDSLKKITKNQVSKRDINLKNAFKRLKDSPDFALLSKWVKYMKDNQFATDPNGLIGMVSIC
ncbi:hypothetical protein [Dysgonomonas sp. 25]|uniref:hypothetical protein n=1 Tax=Dysgonomonas sp. 25 TaxID=2302933 RepID=UPI0013D1A2AD|nr:hypothetical protein [Dysgonomonas sp. 25]NDV67564.1 hypothetical protein [Dysgonomonas sp. 25]